MNNIKYLEFQKLIKELQFVEADYLYQIEIVKLSENKFLKSVEIVTEKFEDLKNMIIENVDKIEIKNNINFKDIEQISDPQLKKLYREIAKSTHPDKISNTKLNNSYIEATQAYESNDIITLYKISHELMIEFEYDDELIQKIKEKINEYKMKISFLEKTYTFKWIKSKTQSEKNEIILEYLKNKLN